MPFRTITLTVALFAAGVLVAQDTPAAKPKAAASKSKARRRTARKSSTAKASGTKSTPTPVASAHSSKSSKSKKTVAATRRSSQQQPSSDRYREIQQALADKGYFSGSADGAWGPDSVDALRRFQRDQNLTDDGKLGSLSLIALGLGPKRAEPQDKSAQR